MGVNQYRAGKRTDGPLPSSGGGQAVKEAGSPIKTREAVNAMEKETLKSRNKPGKAADGKTIKQSIYSSAKSARATENRDPEERPPYHQDF